VISTPTCVRHHDRAHKLASMFWCPHLILERRSRYFVLDLDGKPVTILEVAMFRAGFIFLLLVSFFFLFVAYQRNRVLRA